MTTTPTFASQFGVVSLNDIDLGIGRLDIAILTNQVFQSIGAIEGTARATLNRTKHQVKAGTPMSTVVEFAVDEIGKFALEPLETSRTLQAQLLLGQPANVFTQNSSTSAISVNESITATVGAAAPFMFDIWNLAITPVFSFTSGPGTPLVLNTDYTFDPIHGEFQLIAGGAGGTTGTTHTVFATYAYFLPVDEMTFGGYVSIVTYRLYWSHLRPQDGLWEVLEGYKCTPSVNWVKDYIQNSHNKLPFEFDFLADITRNQGDRIANLRKIIQQPF
jgi:hypothetical protein